MKNYDIKTFETLSNIELITINGGGWRSFGWGYLVAEMLEGIQRGLMADCSEACK